MEKSGSRSQSPQSSPKGRLEELREKKISVSLEYKEIERDLLAKKLVKKIIEEPDDLEKSVQDIDNKNHTPESLLVITKNVLRERDALSASDSASGRSQEKSISEIRLQKLNEKIKEEEKKLSRVEQELVSVVRDEGKERGTRQRIKFEKKLKRHEKDKERQEKIKAFFESLGAELKKGFAKIFKKNNN
jgi:hypothetical protein